MIIGFLEMSRTVTEGAEPHPVELLLISRRPSEIEYSIQLRYLGQISTANVEPIDYRSNTRTIDALFGVSNNGQLTVFRDFLPAKTSQRSLDINIQADLIQEESETLTIGVFPVVGNLQQTFSCNGSMGYHCQFTLFIVDDDGELCSTIKPLKERRYFVASLSRYTILVYYLMIVGLCYGCYLLV